MQRNTIPLPCPVDGSAVINVSDALVPVTERVAALLKPTRTVPRYRDGQYDDDTEMWECRAVTVADVPDLRRQLSLLEAAMRPGEPGTMLARIHGLLAHYRCADLPEAVERAVAADWLDDVGEFPLAVVEQACRAWRRGPKCRFRPMSGEIREMCTEAMGRLPVIADKVRKLLASAPSGVFESTTKRSQDVRGRVLALAAARRMP